MSDPVYSLLTIAAVERETGIGKDTLRAWERRYGFPAPLRNAQGDRAYTWEQVERLRRVRRLVAAGHRPGVLMRLSVAELDVLHREEPAGRRLPAPGTDLPPVPTLLPLDDGLATLRAGGSPALRRWLMQALGEVGLARFVTEGIARLSEDIGGAWVAGRMPVFEEHLFSEAVQTVMRHALLPLQPASHDARPRVLLTTLSGEEHGLGLLMAEAMLALGGATTIALGTVTPMADIVAAAFAQDVDVVGLSFSERVSPVRLRAVLREVRTQLPARFALWVGGAGATRAPGAVPDGCRAMGLADVAPALRDWREEAGAPIACQPAMPTILRSTVQEG